MEKERLDFSVRGFVTDEIKDVETGEVITLETENLVLNSFTRFVASMLKGDTSIFNKLWWEVGSGIDSWDSNLPSPGINDTKLLTPVYRKKIDPTSIKYLNPGDNSESTAITNKVEIVTTFGVNEANYALREFGIFAGGDDKLGSGIPLNRKIHKVISKTEGIELTRKIHFLITLG